MHACLQIMGFGWREGMPTEEARRWFEEARQLALAAGSMRGNAWAHAAFGRVLAANGSADDYVSRMREALALAIDAKDVSVEPMLMASLSQALRLAGHLDEALKVSIEAASRAHEISEWDRQLMGFDAERWLTVMQGQILVLLGRFDEARPYLDRMLQAEVGPNDVTLHLANVAYVDLARGKNDKALAEHHAERAMRMAVESDSPYERVSALACRGISHMTAGRFEAAADQLEKALAFARMKRAGLEGEARILADLAEAYWMNGDFDGAGRTAAEAIEVASARAARIPECLARIVQAEVLLRAGAAERAGLELSKARALMEETGALLYRPLVQDLAERIELGLGKGRAPEVVAKHRNGGAGA
jgi:adenylate cyclase